MKITPISFTAIKNTYDINNSCIHKNQEADSVSFSNNIDETKKRAIDILNESETQYQNAQKIYEKADYIDNFAYPLLKTISHAAKSDKEYTKDKNGYFNIDVPENAECKYFTSKDKLKTKVFEDGTGYFEVNSIKYKGKKMIANMEQGGSIIVIEDGVIDDGKTFSSCETYCYIKNKLVLIKTNTKQDKYGAKYDKVIRYKNGKAEEIGINSTQPDASTIMLEKNMNFKRGRLESCEINKLFTAPNSNSYTEEFQYKRGKIIHKTMQNGKAQKEVIRI